jgi:hypothetical protein
MEINNETFICDEKCITKICKFKRKYISKINFNVTTIELEQIQEKIREQLDKKIFPHLKTSDNKKVKPSKPNYFAIFMLLLHDDYNHLSIKEIYQNLKEIVEQSGNNGLMFNYGGLNIEISLPGDADNSVCCCGQNNCRSDKMTKVSRGNITFIVGSSCVLKTGINFNQICKNVRKTMSLTIPRSKKYPNTEFKWVLENDFRYLEWMYINNYFDDMKDDNLKMKKHKETIRSLIEYKLKHA